MLQITDTGLLKHHRVDYGEHTGEPTRQRPLPSLKGGIAVALALLLALGLYTSATA